MPVFLRQLRRTSVAADSASEPLSTKANTAVPDFFTNSRASCAVARVGAAMPTRRVTQLTMSAASRPPRKLQENEEGAARTEDLRVPLSRSTYSVGFPPLKNLTEGNPSSVKRSATWDKERADANRCTM